MSGNVVFDVGAADATVAAFWNVYLHDKHGIEAAIDPGDVPRMLKLAEVMQPPVTYTWTDPWRKSVGIDLPKEFIKADDIVAIGGFKVGDSVKRKEGDIGMLSAGAVAGFVDGKIAVCWPECRRFECEANAHLYTPEELVHVTS